MERTKSKLMIYSRLEEQRATLLTTNDNEMRHIGRVYDLTDGEGQANASHLVLCWNSHPALIRERDALRLACEEMAKYIEFNVPSRCSCGEPDAAKLKILKQAKAALGGGQDEKV